MQYSSATRSISRCSYLNWQNIWDCNWKKRERFVTFENESMVPLLMVYFWRENFQYSSIFTSFMICRMSYLLQYHNKILQENSSVRHIVTFTAPNILCIMSLILEINMQKYKSLWNVLRLFQVSESNLFHLVSKTSYHKSTLSNV